MPLKKSGGPVVGLDIGSSFIKACEIDCRGGRANLRGLALEPTPPEAVVNNEIIDPVSLGKAIKRLFQQSGIKAKKVITCVTGQSSLVVRIIEVPKMTRAELQETMKWEIERHVPFAAEQVVMDYQPLVAPEEVPEGQNMEVLLAVAQEGLVVRHVEAVQAAGLQPVAIDIEPLASSRALLDLANGSGPQGTVALIDLGASTTDISIYKEGRIAFTRSIQLAGNNLTKAIADVIQQPLAEAERIKRDMARIPDMGGSTQPQFGGDAGMDFGGAPELDFGLGGDVPLGGTFGTAPSEPAVSTATDTHSEAQFDIAGGGFSSDLFTSPAPVAEAAEGTPGLDPAAAAQPAPAEPAASPFGGALLPPGPTPMGNPFDPDAGAPPAAGAAPAAALNPFGGSPFDASPFGPTPGADPFAPADPGFGGFGDPTMTQPDPMATMGGPPAMMSEEEMLRTMIADAIMPVLAELVTEVRRSLDFYRNRANGLGAQQVVISGGTAKLPGLADYLTVNLEVPVTVGNPLQYLAAGPKSDPGYLQEVGPVFQVSVGLAARELLMDVAPPKREKTPKAPKPPKAPKAPKAPKNK